MLLSMSLPALEEPGAPRPRPPAPVLSLAGAMCEWSEQGRARDRSIRGALVRASRPDLILHIQPRPYSTSIVLVQYCPPSSGTT